MIYMLERDYNTAWKVSIHEVFSGPCFPVFRLKTEIYSVKSECRKIRSRKNSVFGQFSCSVKLFFMRWPTQKMRLKENYKFFQSNRRQAIWTRWGLKINMALLILKIPLPKAYHTSYNDATCKSYTLPKGDPKNIWITLNTPWILLKSHFFTGNQQIFLYQEIQI